ncbi:MAG: hypothetical protein GY708_05960 [Actinomycetia bacterium]|nr:hypothetical protein [Actinomycetes bacterium]MCP4962136.1 hypothetical protein [Actinomycetes bacterium]
MRDFVTAVEASTSFAEAVVVEIESVWEALGRPERLDLVEGGSGVGTLALHCLAADSEAVRAVHWVMLEISQALRDTAIVRLDRAGLLIDERVSYVTDIRQIGAGNKVHLILANELLDNLAVRVIRRVTLDRFEELYVDPVRPDTEHWVALGGNDLHRASHHGRLVDVGTEFPLADRAVAWTWAALDRLSSGGRMILFDYGATTSELATRPERGWLRFYRGQRRVNIADTAEGGADITCDVPFDQLPGRPQLTTQAQWLEHRVASLRSPTSHGDRAIVDRSGMGAFTAASWTR